MNSLERRHAATERYARAAAAINAVFDRADELRAATAAVVAAHSSAGDPVQGARAMLEAAACVETALERLRSAAKAAAAFRTKSDLASDIGTRISLLFPRGLVDSEA